VCQSARDGRGEKRAKMAQINARLFSCLIMPAECAITRQINAHFYISVFAERESGLRIHFWWLNEITRPVRDGGSMWEVKIYKWITGNYRGEGRF
jgi:hypothetical protein